MPAHLSAEPNSFVGRERELYELARLVRATRVLTLCGPGGTGKTRLALRLLAAEAATDEDFPDGVCFVELGDLAQGELVPSRVAAALGVSEEPGRPLADTIADVLGPRRLLLALETPALETRAPRAQPHAALSLAPPHGSDRPVHGS